MTKEFRANSMEIKDMFQKQLQMYLGATGNRW